jgi:hypothetical protein
MVLLLALARSAPDGSLKKLRVGISSGNRSSREGRDLSGGVKEIARDLGARAVDRRSIKVDSRYDVADPLL